MKITLLDLNLIEIYNEVALSWRSHVFTENINQRTDDRIFILFKEEIKFL